MMDRGGDILPALSGMVELDKKYVGGKPRYKEYAKHKSGKGTSKHWVLVAVERNGQYLAELVHSDKIAQFCPQLDHFVDKQVHLMTDEYCSYQSIGRQYAAHDWANHSQNEYAHWNVHNNTAESLNAIL